MALPGLVELFAELLSGFVRANRFYSAARGGGYFRRPPCICRNPGNKPKLQKIAQQRRRSAENASQTRVSTHEARWGTFRLIGSVR